MTERVVPAEFVERLRDVARAAAEVLEAQARGHREEEALLDRILAESVEVVDLSGEDTESEVDVTEVVDRRAGGLVESPETLDRPEPTPWEREAPEIGPARVRARPEALWERLSEYQRGVLEKAYRNGGKAQAVGLGATRLRERGLIERTLGPGTMYELTAEGRRICEGVLGNEPDAEPRPGEELPGIVIAVLRTISEQGPRSASKLDPRGAGLARTAGLVEDRGGRTYLTTSGANALARRDRANQITEAQKEV